VGACHPIAISNTYLLYQNGWRGVNIDAMPGSMDVFRHHRPEDLNLEIGIARENAQLTYSMFDDPGLNGFLSEEAIQSQLARGAKLLDQRVVPCVPLSEVLARHSVRSQIDLLTVDVEGLDLEVLQSLDLDRWRPKLIIAEILGASDVRDALRSQIAVYLESVGYCLFSRLHFSAVFMDRKLISPA
jgi:FkbM family methyltransferase